MRSIVLASAVVMSVAGSWWGGCKVGGWYDHSHPVERVSYMPPSFKSEVYAATNGFNHTIPNGVTLEILSSSALLPSGSLTLPSSPNDGEPLTIIAPKGITLSTVVAAGAQGLVGLNITTMGAGTPYRLVYSTQTNSWYPD